MVSSTLVDSVAILLTSSPKPEDVLAYKLPADLQERVSDLLARNREQVLSVEEKEELEQFIFLEHIFRIAKSRARIQLAAS